MIEIKIKYTLSFVLAIIVLFCSTFFMLPASAAVNESGEDVDLTADTCTLSDSSKKILKEQALRQFKEKYGTDIDDYDYAIGYDINSKPQIILYLMEKGTSGGFIYDDALIPVNKGGSCRMFRVSSNVFETSMTELTIYVNDRDVSNSVLETTRLQCRFGVAESNVAIYDKYGDVSSSNAFTVSCNYSDPTGLVNVNITANISGKFNGYVTLHNQKSEPCYATMISYGEADDNSHMEFSKDNPYHWTFSPQDFIDKCSDKKTYSDDIYIWVSISGASNYDKYFAFNVKTLMESDTNKSLFSTKKDYLDFPALTDYLEGFPECPDFDIEHPLDSIWNIIKWIGSCLWVLVKNIFNFFNWLGACFVVLIKNIGIALYNLVVDIKRLFIWLFVPEADELDYVITEKFPAFNKISSAITAARNTSASAMTFELFGHEFSFDFSNTPSEFQGYIYYASSICMYALQVFMIIKMLCKCFGVNIVCGGDDNDN